jgi:hypothetical protein
LDREECHQGKCSYDANDSNLQEERFVAPQQKAKPKGGTCNCREQSGYVMDIQAGYKR